MRKKHNGTGAVIFGIFIAALISVLVLVFMVYQTGFKYIKTNTGTKYFGYVDNQNRLINVRMWYQDTAANIQLQKFYIVEIKDETLFEPLRILNLTSSDDVLKIINDTLPDDLTARFPMNNFIFNSSDDSIIFHKDKFDIVIKNHESIKNNIKSGEIYTPDGIKWVLSSTKTNPSSYKDFEVSQESDKLKIYKGDVLKFLSDEQLSFASFTLADGSLINLYPAYNIYKVSYEKGRYTGDLYIGAINADLEKDGRGIYYFYNSDVLYYIYYGDFVKNEKTGYCEVLMSDGDSYMGFMSNGKREGEGVSKWSDGSTYTGGFKNDMKNGYGVDIFADGSSYEGYYVDDIKEGKGKYIWANGNMYEGEFENDLYKGKGKFTWANGEYYEGEFMHNSVHGWGTYYWPVGRGSYEGWWDQGRMVLEKPSDIDDAIADGDNNNMDDINIVIDD